MNVQRQTFNVQLKTLDLESGLKSFSGLDVGRWTLDVLFPKDELLHSPAFDGSSDQTSFFTARAWLRLHAKALHAFFCAEKQTQRRRLRKGSEGFVARK